MNKKATRRMDSEYRNIALTIIAAVIISLIISITFVVFIVPPYLHATNRAINIFDFYEHIGPNNIYFIGSSQIADDVDTRMIGPDAYNLGWGGDTPLRRLIELNQLIKTQPRTVIIGLSYFGLNDSPVIVLQADLIAPVADKIKTVPREFFTEEELKLIDTNPFYYNRKFIGSSLLALIHNDESEDVANFTIPDNPAKNLTYQERVDLVNNGGADSSVVPENDCNQKRALNYTIYELQKAGIYVMVINMPLNPLLSAKISNETRKSYFNFLNSTGVKYYDFERSFSDKYFADLVHLNSAGRKCFTELLCPIVQ